MIKKNYREEKISDVIRGLGHCEDEIEYLREIMKIFEILKRPDLSGNDSDFEETFNIFENCRTELFYVDEPLLFMKECDGDDEDDEKNNIHFIEDVERYLNSFQQNFEKMKKSLPNNMEGIVFGYNIKDCIEHSLSLCEEYFKESLKIFESVRLIKL